MQHKDYLCERCSKHNDPVVAKVVHHKIYLTKQNINDISISLSWENLESLCQDCHNKEHHQNKNKRYCFDEDGNIIYSPHKI